MLDSGDPANTWDSLLMAAKNEIARLDSILADRILDLETDSTADDIDRI